jgi:hypothetical protein
MTKNKGGQSLHTEAKKLVSLQNCTETQMQMLRLLPTTHLAERTAIFLAFIDNTY